MSFGNHHLLRKSLPIWRDSKGSPNNSARFVLRLLLFTILFALFGLFVSQLYISSRADASRLKIKHPAASSKPSNHWANHDEKHAVFNKQAHDAAYLSPSPNLPEELGLPPPPPPSDDILYDSSAVLPSPEPREGMPSSTHFDDANGTRTSSKPWYAKLNDRFHGFHQRVSEALPAARSAYHSTPQSLYPALADSLVGERVPNEEIEQPVYTHGDRPYLGKVTVNVAASDDTDNHYERGIRTHATQNKLHNYAMFTLRYSLTAKADQMWSKPAYLMLIILRELAKPAEDRLQWLFWVDADTVIANPRVPVETFLPPVEYNDIHLLLTNDFNGLNNGIFPIRVCMWSIDFLAAVMAYSHYNPDVTLKFHEQSAMERLLKEPKFSDHVEYVPQRWFNAYPGERNETSQPYMVKRGDMLIHFAGFSNKKEMMSRWLQRVELHDPEWEIDLIHTAYPNEVRDFWADVNRKGKDRKAELDKAQQEAHALIEDIKVYMKEYKEDVDYMRRESIKKAVRALRAVLDADGKKESREVLTSASYDLREIAEPLITRARKANRILYEEAHGLLLRYEEERADAPHVSEAKAEADQLKTQLSNLRKLLVDNKASPRFLERAISEVNSAHESLKKKIELVKEGKAAEKHEEELASLDGEIHNDDLDEIDADLTAKEKAKEGKDDDDDDDDENKEKSGESSSTDDHAQEADDGE
ncbi:MAG: hypothetical protein Q9159_006956 [Coniocarpon cinnabarinum]